MLVNIRAGHKFKLITAVPVLLLVILLLLTTASHIVLFKQSYDEQVTLLIQESKQTLGILKQVSEVYVTQNDNEDLLDFYSSINSHQHLKRLRYISSVGNIVYSSLFYEVNDRISTSSLIELSQLRYPQLNRDDQNNTFELIYPVRNIKGNLLQVLGYIHGQYSTEHIRYIVQDKMIKSYLLSISLVFLIMGLLMMILYFSFHRPLLSIKYALTQMAKNNYDVEIRDSIWSEFSDLARHGNQTRKLLKQHSINEQQELKEKDRFIASVSHELRTPLNGIIGMAELINKEPLSHKGKDYLSKMIHSSKTLLDVVNEILDFSKIRAGQLSIDKHSFDLHSAFNHIFSVFTHLAHDKDLDFRIFIDPDIPTPVIGDSYRIQQVLNNLCSNALKFTETGKISISIDLIKRSGADLWVNFKVEDSGIGIDEKSKVYLFEAFRQEDETTSRRYGGTGLGLYISKKIVEHLDGSIHYETAQGEGSTFEFSIPMQVGSAPLSVAEDTETIDIDLNNQSMLIVDDNHINVEVASALMADYCNDIDIAYSGKEGLNKATDKHYSIILMDIHMPEMDGIEAMKKLRELPEYSASCIIALTANVLQQDQDYYLEQGFDAVQPKPFDAYELALSIYQCLQKQ